MRRAAHVDSTHGIVVEALRALGCTVQSLATVGKGCPDLLVGWRGRTLLVEVKSPPKVRKKGAELDESQVDWLSKWRGAPVIVARSPEEAVAEVLKACA